MHVRVPIPRPAFIFNTTALRCTPRRPPSSCAFSTTIPFRFSHPPHHSPLSSPVLSRSDPRSLQAVMAGTGAATATVCSMCGDVGFPEKLFRCARCRHRFQHSYCTNYYGDSAPASAGSDMCDWCLSDVASGKARWSSSSPAGKQHATPGSQESSSTTTSSGGSGRGAGGKASGGGDQAELAGRRATTRAAGRRYKLLKDVLCE